MNKFFALFISVGLIFSTGAAAQSAEEDFVKSTQNDLTLVAVAGASGAVLGLSTLSFVDKPSKHISNIWTGAALGVIAGVIFVAYNSAQKGQEGLEMEEASSGFRTSERLAWHEQNLQKLTFEKVQFGTDIYRINF